tara:strand:- start:58 stop:249 length:192 start_codon:yes stop_codon:yes gene_type:complete
MPTPRQRRFIEVIAIAYEEHQPDLDDLEDIVQQCLDTPGVELMTIDELFDLVDELVTGGEGES